MEILGGKSFENGIEFIVRTDTEGYIFSARRNEQDEIRTMIKGRYTKVKTTSYCAYLVSAVSTFLFVLLFRLFKDVKNENLVKLGCVLALIVFWLWLISFLYVYGKNPKNRSAGRYHSVEHKILNFNQEYGYLPRTTDDIEKMSSINIACGSTVIVVIALFSTLAFLSVLMIPTIFLKIVGVIISVVITMYCWANGKCDFAQKWMLKPPTHKEIELGVYAMKILSKEENVL